MNGRDDDDDGSKSISGNGTFLSHFVGAGGENAAAAAKCTFLLSHLAVTFFTIFVVFLTFKYNRVPFFCAAAGGHSLGMAARHSTMFALTTPPKTHSTR